MIAQLSGKFTADPKMIRFVRMLQFGACIIHAMAAMSFRRRRIEALIDQSYLERKEGNVFKYLA